MADVDGTGTANPLAGAIGRAYAYGRSQSGRFLRQMLYLGLNRDESARVVFDGMLPNVAGGKMGEFNVRFGQPSSLSNRSVNNLPPFLDIEPGGERRDTGRGYAAWGCSQGHLHQHVVGVLGRARRAGAHVTADGAADVALPDNVRSWLFCGTQHAPANLPISDTNPDTGARGTQALNYVDYRPLMRAALYHLDRWVTHNEEPPGNGYPNHADGSVVHADDLGDWFRALPGVEFPQHHKVMRRLDFGPERAVPTVMPPAVGDEYPSLVSAVDGDGNEIGGIRLPAIAVPLATYTGWNVRHPDIGGVGQVHVAGRNAGGRRDTLCGYSERTAGVGRPQAVD